MDLGDRIAVLSRVTHDASFVLDAAPVAGLTKHQTVAELEDVAVAATRDQCTLLHRPPFYTATANTPTLGPRQLTDLTTERQLCVN